MKQGYLSEFFKAVAIKKLSAVEINPARSHQREFNGVKELQAMLGNIRREFPTKCIYLNDDEPVSDETTMTWYDARKKHQKRTEWRLYPKATAVSFLGAEGDTLIICQNQDDSLLMIIAEKDSTIEKQLLWLFGVGETISSIFTVKATLETEQDRLQFASRYILEKIGIEPQEEDENLLDVMLREFGGGFPTTDIFSAFARNSIPDISAKDNPDQALLAWMNQEDILFRTLEKHLIADRISKGWEVEDFISFSLSVHNRRKSRAGFAFENHVEQIFKDVGVAYSRTKITEGNKKPDFVFPHIDLYHNDRFPNDLLTMLGAKTTSKDRWRQILNEADKIIHKHLLTLEPSISENQTDEMTACGLSLVVPDEVRNTYTETQRRQIMTVRDFVDLAIDRQQKIPAGFMLPA